jgi:hypothetical protein
MSGVSGLSPEGEKEFDTGPHGEIHDSKYNKPTKYGCPMCQLGKRLLESSKHSLVFDWVRLVDAKEGRVSSFVYERCKRSMVFWELQRHPPDKETVF